MISLEGKFLRIYITIQNEHHLLVLGCTQYETLIRNMNNQSTQTIGKDCNGKKISTVFDCQVIQSSFDPAKLVCLHKLNGFGTNTIVKLI